jgi:membrane protein DedA with SNARE-associated domain
MKFLSVFIKILLIIVWAFLLLYISKAMGVDYSPDETSGVRNMFRLIIGVLILLGAYFIMRIKLFRKTKEKD